MAARIPPPTPEYLKFLQPFGPAIIDLALAVRKLVLSETKGAIELIYDAYNAVAAGYTFTGRPSDACIHIAVYARWVNLGFHRGSQLPDPEKRLQGTGNWVRHIRITSKEDLNDPAIRAFVKTAVERAIYPDPKSKPAPSSVVRGNYPRKRRPAKPGLPSRESN
jgi:hypothetical protein